MPRSDSDDWVVEIKMGIRETKLLYNHICDSLENPGPRKVASSIEELEYLKKLRMKLFVMLCEQQLLHFHFLLLMLPSLLLVKSLPFLYKLLI